VSLSPPLNIQAIESGLVTHSLGRRTELHEQIGSTNREAIALAQAGVEHGTVVVADAQTEGRGRLARTWFSPPGINLYCSIILKRDVSDNRLSGWLSWLPLITALAVAEAIETVAQTNVGVKWPNDLLIAERKVGGILCESGTVKSSGPFQVAGIGLNVNGAVTGFPEEIRDLATTIRHETGRSVDRNRLLAQILNELETCVEEFDARGSERISLAYRQRCSTIGKTVKAKMADGTELIGHAGGIGQDGSLTIMRHPLLPDGRTPETIHLRVADIIHVRI